MDLPPFSHHHHHRYVRPPPNFSDNPNFYPNQPQRLPPPPVPSLPPPPLQPHRLSHPPPPLPPPSQTQFTFRPQPLDERPPPQFSNFIPSHVLNHRQPHPHPPSPPRVLTHNHHNRQPHPHPPSPPRVLTHNHHNRRNLDLFDDNSRISDPWSDLPPVSRVPPEPSFRHHNHNHNRPVSPFRPRNESYLNDFDRSFRFREEFVDERFRDDVNPELPLWGRKDTDFDGHGDLDERRYHYRGGRNGYDLNLERIDMEFASANLQHDDMGLEPSRDFELNVGNFESYNDDGEKDSVWGYSSLDKNSVNINSHWASVRSREFSESGWHDTVGRFNNFRQGGGTEEFFNPSPRKKQVQKKSALLRIQLGKASNSRNRSRDHGHFLKGYNDESSSSGGGSFKGKVRDVFLCSDRKMEEEREKSPVELDVSFKSNALVAKAIKSTPSPVADSNKNFIPRNRKLRKINFSDSPGIKLNDDLIKPESSTDHRSGFDKNHGQLKEKVISDRTDRAKCGLASPSGLNRDRKESAEKDITFKTDNSTYGLGFPVDSDKDWKESTKMVITVETESCIHGFDLPSGTDKDLGQLEKKTRVSGSLDAPNCGSQPCSSGTYVVDGNSGNKESPELVPLDQGAKGVASYGTSAQSTSKRKRVIIPFQHESLQQSKNDASDLTNQDNLSKDTTQSIQSDELVNGSEERVSSVETSFVNNAVALQSLVDDYTDEKLKNASQVAVSNSRKDNVIDSSHHLLLQSPVLIPVSSNLRYMNLCKGADHADRSLQDGYSGSEFESLNESVVSGNVGPDGAHKHPPSNELMLFENGLGGKVMDSVESSAGFSSPKEDKIYDGQINVCISNNDASSVSCSDEIFCRSSESITIYDLASRNAGSEGSLPIKLNISQDNEVIKGSRDPVFFDGSDGVLCSSKAKKTIAREASTIQGCSNATYSTSDFTDALGIRTVSESGLVDVSSKQTLDTATKIPENSPVEGSSNAKVSGLDIFIDQCDEVDSPRIKRKREVGDDHLGIYDKNMSEIDEGMVCNVHDEDGSARCLYKSILSIDKEVVPGEGNMTSRDSLDEGSNGSLDEGPSDVNLTVGGKKRKVSFPRSVSSVLSDTYQNPEGANLSAVSEKFPLNLEELATPSECRIALSGPDDIFLSSLKACSEPSLVDAVVVKSHQAASHGDDFTGGSSELEHVTSCSPKKKADRKGNASVIVSTDGLQIRPDMDKNLPCGDGDCENYTPSKENVASFSSNFPLCADVDGVSFSSSDDRPIDSVPDAASNRPALEEGLSIVVSDAQNNESRPSKTANGYSTKDNTLFMKPVSGDDNMPYSLKTSSRKSHTKGGKVGMDLPLSTNTVSPLSHNAKKVTLNPNPLLDKSSYNNQLVTSFSRGFPGQTSVKYPSTKIGSPFNHVVKPRTWHRTGTPSTSVAGSKVQGNRVAQQIHPQKEVIKVPSSYIRKGNSLVRKPSPVGSVSQGLHTSFSSVYRLSPVVDDVKKGRGSGNRSDSVDPPSSRTLGRINSVPETPKTPSLIVAEKSLSTPPEPGDTTSLTSAALPGNDHHGEAFDPSISAENTDLKKCFKDCLKPSGVNECLSGSSNNLDCPSTLNDRNLEKQIIYVKRKSNQLVAASNSGDLSLQGAEKTQALSSDTYYKRRKNQLIRTPLEEEVKKSAIVPLKNLNLQGKEAQRNTQNKSSSKRQSGFARKKFSLVWTLHGTLSTTKDGNSGRHNKAQPYLFPWKNFRHSLSSISNDTPVSTISRRLLLSRKRNTIYKRSISGFSLRRSKVLSVGGRSLKWSKSIEKYSRKANEDATLAVVAAEKMEREQNGAAFNLFKSRNYVPRKSVFSVKLRPGERVFRIGSERYRMDPTRKTLQRISDDKPSYSNEQTQMISKKFYVPRRLLIGNDEYVQIGNGNKLVRDPKKRTRVLANEKVRWSLHTARLRLARKKKYCQFFTRFGKCNKDDRKCPYIHDPSKIAVCTKFLNDSCSNPNCKLTHKVIPERMQDCSYFLQGLCSNESCPYRHVNVNPNAPICEGFLRGYCAEGDECRKKHTYVCPVFEATGNCQQGAKCKLHHPKKKNKGTKRKALSMQKNAQGRYFGVRPIDIANSSRSSESKSLSEKGDDNIFCQDGKFADYISLDVSDEAIEQVPEPSAEPSCDSEDPVDIQSSDLDELIKPIRIMNRSVNLD